MLCHVTATTGPIFALSPSLCAHCSCSISPRYCLCVVFSLVQFFTHNSCKDKPGYKCVLFQCELVCLDRPKADGRWDAYAHTRTHTHTLPHIHTFMRSCLAKTQAACCGDNKVCASLEMDPSHCGTCNTRFATLKHTHTHTLTHTHAGVTLTVCVVMDNV